MKILLTNDDGFGSDGIQALEDVLVKAGHEVWVCAPSAHKSSTSHSLSFLDGTLPVEIEKHRYSLNGQPADCMLVALGKKAISFEPDVVISGINSGFNLSIDVLYSGTCGAASEASLWGYKSIAISAQKPQNGNSEVYYVAAKFLENHLVEFVNVISSSVTLNINVPKDSDGVSWKVGKQLTMVHRDIGCPNDNGVLQNGIKDIERGVFDSDLAICASGKISVTPIDICPAVSAEIVKKIEMILEQ